MKSFTATKFREGYDPDEVDDFLDEVIWTIGQLQNENTELKAQLEEAQNKLAAAGQGGETAVESAGAADERVAALEAELKTARERITELESAPAAASSAGDEQVETLKEQLSQANARIEQLQAEAQDHSAAAESQVSDNSGDSQSATSMLALAQRVHDEYVRDGQTEGNRIIEDAKAQGRQLIHEAEQRRDEVVQEMENRRDELQGRIEELKSFENDYRNTLRGHLESLLGHVNEQTH